jgi:HPt (histidine-containing phosphotransfer) domain-containing protein
VFEGQVIDRPKLDVFRQELGKRYKIIFGYFREDGARWIAAIEDAARRRSVVALVRPAHTLRGESLQFGATSLGLMAERIEMAARNAIASASFPADIADYVAQLRPLFDEAMAVLTRETIRVSPIRRMAGLSRRIAFGF